MVFTQIQYIDKSVVVPCARTSAFGSVAQEDCGVPRGTEDSGFCSSEEVFEDAHRVQACVAVDQEVSVDASAE